MNELNTTSSEILELIPDIMYRLDENGNISWISHSINIYGYTEDELVGRNIFELVHPDDRNKAQHKLNERRVGDRRTRYFEVRLVTKDRESIPFEISTDIQEDNPVFLLDAKGLYDSEISTEHFWGTFGIAKNITERKQSQVQIQKSERMYRMLVEDMPALVSRFSINGTITFVNDEYCAFYSKKREELIGHDFFHLIPEKDRKSVKGHYNSLTIDNPTVTYEHEVISPAGPRHQLWTDRLLTDEEGIPSEYQSIGFDITARKQIEVELETRLVYEEGLACTSKVLLEEGNSEQALPCALLCLQKASGASRVYIYENNNDPVKGLYTRYMYEACASGIEPQIQNPLLQNISLKDRFERWAKFFSQGKPLMGEVKTFPENEREILETQSIKSILVLPYSVEGEWSGFIGFDDTEKVRQWSEDDIRLLRLAAELIGAYYERKLLEKNMHELATKDDLTKCFNRRYFLELAGKEMTRARRYKHPTSLILFDIDLFKNVNDIYGHAAGDTVLKQLSDATRKRLRDMDILGRIGGEEFAIVLAETDIKGAIILAERLRESIEKEPFQATEETISVTISIGIAEWNGTDELTKLLATADKMLYTAKNNGRNTVKWDTV
ncbi:diguanylate cyclase [Candidatus Latescibacterota bacterium]